MADRVASGSALGPPDAAGRPATQQAADETGLGSTRDRPRHRPGPARTGRGPSPARCGSACRWTACAELTATVTATAATNGKRLRPVGLRHLLTSSPSADVWCCHFHRPTGGELTWPQT